MPNHHPNPRSLQNNSSDIPDDSKIDGATAAERYGVLVNYTEDGDNLLIDVPLSSIEEELGETPLAFEGQMVYQAGENWGTVHEGRLGWMVNASQEGKSVSKEDDEVYEQWSAPI